MRLVETTGALVEHLAGQHDQRSHAGGRGLVKQAHPELRAALDQFTPEERSTILRHASMTEVPSRLEDVPHYHSEHWNITPAEAAEELRAMADYRGVWADQPQEMAQMLHRAGGVFRYSVEQNSEFIRRPDWMFQLGEAKLSQGLSFEQWHAEYHRLKEHLPGRHNQKSHGRSFGRMADTTTREGGLSANYIGRAPKTGYMVGGVVPSRTVDAAAGRAAISSVIREFYSENRAVLKRPGTYLGTWVDGGKVYIDISQRTGTKKRALELGRARGELAVYDVARGESVDVPEVRTVRLAASTEVDG